MHDEHPGPPEMLTEESDLESYDIQVLIGTSDNLIDLIEEGEENPGCAVFSANGLVGSVRYSDSHPRIFCSTNGERVSDAKAASLVSAPPPFPVLIKCLKSRPASGVIDRSADLLLSISELWAFDSEDVDRVVNEWRKYYGWYRLWEGQLRGEKARFMSPPILGPSPLSFSSIFWSNCSTLTDLVVAGERFREALVLSANARVGTFYCKASESRMHGEIFRGSSLELISEEKAVQLVQADAEPPSIFADINSSSPRVLNFAVALARTRRDFPVRPLLDELWSGVANWKRMYRALSR